MTDATVCPYCRMPFDESGPPTVYCTACGVPHHEDCYQENGGCTVFGCAQAPADDPKLQVSQSDLNAVGAAATQTPSVQSRPLTPVSPLSSHYGGPLGLAQPASASGTAVAAAPTSVLSPAGSLVAGRQPKSRTTYIVLGVFLGAFGAHNFYAGYTGRASGQLCLSVLSLFRLTIILGIVAWIWAIVEICVVDKDSAGIQFG